MKLIMLGIGLSLLACSCSDNKNSSDGLTFFNNGVSILQAYPEPKQAETEFASPNFPVGACITGAKSDDTNPNYYRIEKLQDGTYEATFVSKKVPTHLSHFIEYNIEIPFSDQNHYRQISCPFQ